MGRREALRRAALDAVDKAYAPYSTFGVGAAVLTTDGNIYTGANIENASYGATVCAERVAIFHAVHRGEKKISALAVAIADDALPKPCGICRQVMAEFAADDFTLYLVRHDGSYEAKTLDEVLPFAFTPQDLLD